MGKDARSGWWGGTRRVVAAALFAFAVFAGTAPMMTTSADEGGGHIAPNSGPTAGGTAVTITGQHFTGVSAVSFGDTAATDVTVVNDTTITATTPVHGPGVVPVLVRAGISDPSAVAGGPRIVGQFTFTGAAALAIARVEPSAGPTAGQQPFAVIGGGFAPNATVTLGGAAATDVHLLAEGVLIGRTPAHAAGAVDVTVANPGGASVTKTNGYTYGDPAPGAAPTIARLDPSHGPATEGSTTASAPQNGDDANEPHGTIVAVIGTNFRQGATVTFGGVASPHVAFAGQTTLFAAAPPHAAGAVDVTVTNPDTQSATLAGGFTYDPVQHAPLAIREIEPSSGPTGASETRRVVIEGAGFQQGATVSFGGAAATDVTVLRSEVITANAPDHAPGAVDVVVTNPDSQSATKTNGYTYFTPVRVASISPTSGPAAGGTVVTITGTNFQQGATVAFGDDAATAVTVSNDGTTITATTPTHRPGIATVIVTNPDHHRGALPAAFAFTGGNEDPPTATLAVRRVEPPVGPVAGGMPIVVRGTGFATGMTVTVGGSAATDVHVLNSTTIVATTPAHAAGQVAVTVSDGNGASATLANAYTYATASNDRHTWEDPTNPQSGAPGNQPTARPGGTSGPGGAVGTAGTSGAAPAPAPVPPAR